MLLLWFYSSTTLREHILIANGSKIRRWWLVHHYLAIFLASVMLTWYEASFLSVAQLTASFNQQAVWPRLRAISLAVHGLFLLHWYTL